jgi:outer membrane protein assembly factor BamB
MRCLGSGWVGLILVGFAGVALAAEPAATPTWRWRHPPREGSGSRELCGPGCLARVDLPGGGLAELRVLEPRAEVLAVQARAKEGGSLSWERKLEPGQGDAGALLAAGDRIFVAQHHGIASGCHLHALDARDGRVVWSVSLQALGPVSHSQYLNSVQLDEEGGRVVVFGDEIGGKYIELVDPATGQSLANTRVDEVLAGVPWSWEEKRREWPGPRPIVLPARDGGRYECLLTEKPERATVRRLGPDGKERWARQIPPEFVGAASLLELGDALYVAHHCAISSGVTVYAFEAEGGAPRFTVHPRGLGPIEHSKYSNQVELRAVDGRPVVFGHESAGDYIEAFDPRTGLSLANQSWPRW